MTELLPLSSVLEQYKADTRTIVRLREEVRNLSGSLATIQEEMGAYGYEDLQQRVMALEARLHACALQCSCLENPRDGEPGGLQSMGLQSWTRLTRLELPES